MFWSYKIYIFLYNFLKRDDSILKQESRGFIPNCTRSIAYAKDVIQNLRANNYNEDFIYSKEYRNFVIRQLEEMTKITYINQMNII